MADWRRHCVAVKDGRVVAKDANGRQAPRRRVMVVIDPFDGEDNVCRAVTEEVRVCVHV